jgi:hypothetical protein
VLGHHFFFGARLKFNCPLGRRHGNLPSSIAFSLHKNMLSSILEYLELRGDFVFSLFVSSFRRCGGHSFLGLALLSLLGQTGHYALGALVSSCFRALIGLYFLKELSLGIFLLGRNGTLVAEHLEIVPGFLSRTDFGLKLHIAYILQLRQDFGCLLVVSWDH